MKVTYKMKKTKIFNNNLKSRMINEVRIEIIKV